jgi:diguanylate cyclase (GGDEF)-like protein/PAS domain S-box-containing protein
MTDLNAALIASVAALLLAALLALAGRLWAIGRKRDKSLVLRIALAVSREALLACRNGLITHINEAGLRLLNEPEADAVGHSFSRFIHPDYQMLCTDNFEALLAEPAATPAKLRHASGRVLDVQISAWRSADDPDDILISLRDISDLMRANHNVAAQLKRLNSILDTAFDAIIVSDQQGRIEIFNHAAELMFGYRAREILGKPLASLFASRISDQPTAAADVTGRRKDGNIFPAEMSLSACQLDDRVLSTALIRDVTERKNFENRLAHAATHDSLTELPNRTLLLDRLQEAIGNASRSGNVVALWFFDLNGIKTVNDVMGHAAGDQLLIAVGNRMAEIVAYSGTVARFGGDEFAVIMGGFGDEAEVVPAVESFLRELSRPFTLLGREVTVTANVGIALHPQHSRTASDLLLDASAAMMYSKVAGRNQYRLFDPIMHRQSEERLTLESELRRGIERDELALYYQPQVDLGSGRIVGMEALVRWRHPVRGLVAPEMFIGIAEQTGVIGRLGEWVLRRACHDLQRLEAMGLGGVRVGVNISPRQFTDPDIVAKIRSIVEESRITPSDLDIEITETTLMSDPERVIVQLQQLKSRGIHISLDDFGTGFSSLNYLKRFPADTLKLDRSFVADVAAGSKDEAIAMTIVTLAHSMGMTALAEGVEKLDQYELLLHLGCDVAQGYLFSPPLTFDEMVKHLEGGIELLPPAPALKQA